MGTVVTVSYLAAALAAYTIATVDNRTDEPFWMRLLIALLWPLVTIVLVSYLYDLFKEFITKED